MIHPHVDIWALIHAIQPKLPKSSENTLYNKYLPLLLMPLCNEYLMRLLPCSEIPPAHSYHGDLGLSEWFPLCTCFLAFLFIYFRSG